MGWGKPPEEDIQPPDPVDGDRIRRIAREEIAAAVSAIKAAITDEDA